ncbi:MAG: hypothetical protein JW993_09495 [Sedimentisphaerales bacterium]|nr:hypothetical protein [Sedimentisphaerales bacterium]
MHRPRDLESRLIWSRTIVIIEAAGKGFEMRPAVVCAASVLVGVQNVHQVRPSFVAENALEMPSYRTVEMAVMLAGLILPAWPIWRIRRPWIALPISALLSCWFLFISSALTVELVPSYDGIGAAMTMVVSPFVGTVYALVLTGIHRATSSLSARRQSSTPAAPHRSNALVGLTTWAGLLVFAIVLPLVAPPRACRGDPLFLADYLFFCGPILLLAVVMVLTHLFRWRRLARTATPQGP